MSVSYRGQRRPSIHPVTAGSPARLALFAALTLLAWGCGPIHLGNSTPNDPTPTGTIVAQGSFTSVNGQTVTGATEIYSQGSDSYVLRLDGISTPTQAGLQAIVMNGGTAVVTETLTAYAGSINYSFSTGTTNFDQVRIYSPTQLEDYGVASLQP